MNDSIGVDISKDYLDVQRMSDGGAVQFANAAALSQFGEVGWHGSACAGAGLLASPCSLYGPALPDRFRQILSGPI